MTGLKVDKRGFTLSNEQDINVNNVSATPDAVEQPKQEKLYTSAEVDGLVRHKIEKTRANVEAEYAEKLKSLQQTPAAAPAPVVPDVDKIAAEIERRMEAKYKQQQEAAAQQEYMRAAEKVAQEYNSKLAEARQSGEYPDLDEVLQDFDHQAHEFLLWGANMMPNTVAIMREMADNPLKAMQWEQLARSNPAAFQKALKKFSDSLEQTRAAKQSVSRAPSPLSSVKSSITTSAASTGSADDMESLKALYRF